MKDFHLGSFDKRQLHLRFAAPYTFNEWTGDTFRFAPIRLLNPRNWTRTIFSRYGWLFHWSYYRCANHRCWCNVGLLFDGNLHIAGWVFQWFYSRYGGPVPCPCDEVIAELERELEREEAEPRC